MRAYPTLIAALTFVALFCGAAAHAAIVDLTLNPCLSRKLKAVGRSDVQRARCAAKNAASPNAAELAACAMRAEDRFDGGTDPSKGKFEKLETRYPLPPDACRTFDDTAAHSNDLTTYIDGLTTAVGSNPSGSTCDATKIRCLGKYVAGVLGCYAKAASRSASVDSTCTAKYAAKLADGDRGCLDRAAGRDDCTNAGSQASTLKAAADAFILSEACALDPGNVGCFPPCPLAAPTLPAGPSPLHRPADPVVLTGADVDPRLTGIAPNLLVAFRYDTGWVQIPVQVDERDVINFDTVYNNTSFAYGSGGGFTNVDYTDPGTHTGADGDPTLDNDDEIVFMAADAGVQPGTFSEPAGVVANSGMEVAVTDPLTAEVGYVYLFRQDGSLSADAGQQYVLYNFQFLSGPYLTTYQIADGPNPEDSRVCTSEYQRHFSDRWLQDELRVFSGASSGVDILDRNKVLFFPAFCGRSEDSFDGVFDFGEGAFIINKSGPVRAIRSYIGANSGPRSQQQNLFYRGREEDSAFLRVHSIPSILIFRDLSPAAAGMTYANINNPGGVTVDGNPESLVGGNPQWELVTGTQGSVAFASVVETNIAGITPTTYYLDDATSPADVQCTGDAYAYGSSGVWINQSLPDTDPFNGSTKYLRGRQVLYYDAPGLTATDAAQRRAWVTSPLTYSSAPW